MTFSIGPGFNIAYNSIVAGVLTTKLTDAESPVLPSPETTSLSLEEQLKLKEQQIALELERQKQEQALRDQYLAQQTAIIKKNIDGIRSPYGQ
jgi:hypothetical protein